MGTQFVNLTTIRNEKEKEKDSPQPNEDEKNKDEKLSNRDEEKTNRDEEKTNRDEEKTSNGDGESPNRDEETNRDEKTYQRPVLLDRETIKKMIFSTGNDIFSEIIEEKINPKTGGQKTTEAVKWEATPRTEEEKMEEQRRRRAEYLKRRLNIAYRRYVEGNKK